MTGRTINVSPRIKIVLDNEGFKELRHAPALEELFHERGEAWVTRLNAELHEAQAKRKQPIEDGYVYHIRPEGDRLRLYIVAATARAQAHERKHSSILKLMETTGWEVKSRGELEKRAKSRAAAKKRKAARQEANRRAEEFVRIHDEARGLAPSEHPPHNLDES